MWLQSSLHTSIAINILQNSSETWWGCLVVKRTCLYPQSFLLFHSIEEILIMFHSPFTHYFSTLSFFLCYQCCICGHDWSLSSTVLISLSYVHPASGDDFNERWWLTVNFVVLFSGMFTAVFQLLKAFLISIILIFVSFKVATLILLLLDNSMDFY